MGAAGQRKRKTRRKRTGSAASEGERAEAPAPASGGGQDAKAKAKTQNPRHGTIAFTSKTTPQASCGAYIKNAPCGFIPQGAGYMDLSAVFSLAAVKDGAGQGSTCSQHNRNPKSNIAVVAGLR